MNPSRRNFLKKSILAASAIGAAAVIPSNVWSSGFAPGDKVNVALIGCRNMGFGILKHHLDTKMVNCLALCDIDKNILDEKAAIVNKDYNQTPELFGDYRKVLERKDIDAVIIGTPDHWHCLIVVEACQAGKDVYVEKPMSNTIGECNIMVKAANRYNRVVQVGQQQRDNKVFKDVMGLIKSGEIGTLRKVNIWANFNYGLGSMPKPDGPVPAGVDYDFWLGPAPERPFNPNRFHGTWRHYWDYGGGLMSDWGVHLLYPEWDNSKKAPKAEEIAYNKGHESHREHVDNFLVCIKSREKTSCLPEVGRAAAIHAHIANIAARVGADVLEWDDANKRFTNNEKANDLITPVYRAPWKLPVV